MNNHRLIIFDNSLHTFVDCIQVISKKEENKLNISQWIQLKLHLGICSLCRLFEEQNKMIAKAFAYYKETNTILLPEEKKQQIIEAVLSTIDWLYQIALLNIFKCLALSLNIRIPSFNVMYSSWCCDLLRLLISNNIFQCLIISFHPKNKEWVGS